MRLPDLPFLSKKQKLEYFLSLNFQSDKITALLFSDENKSLKILGSAETKIDLEASQTEDFVVAADQVISKIELSLPEGESVEKTIFAVPYAWVEDGKIKPQRLSQLKKVSVELALVPMGFVVSIEAIVAFLQQKEGAPVSGIFIDVSENILALFLVRNGNIIEVKSGAFEESAEQTVENLLLSVEKFDVLPPKIILLYNDEADRIQQKFLSHHWTKDLAFQHLPQVAILDKGFENEAVIHGIAAQMGASLKGETAVSKFEEAGEDEVEITEVSDNFGFIKDQDVALTEHVEEEPEKEPEEIKVRDVLRDEPEEEVEGGIEEIYEESEGKIPRKSIFAIFSGFLPKGMPKIHLPVAFLGTRSLIIPIAAGVVVVLFAAIYYMLLLKAEVILFTDQKSFQDKVNIVLSTSGESSFSDKTLRIQTLTEEVAGDESLDTTGKKETGEKARGEVTIYNKSDKKQNFSKGAKITSSNNLAFVLSDNVEIASTSAFSTEFSNKKAKVEAGKFGKEYNLPSSTNFTVEDLASAQVFAKNDTAFAGGTKEEIQVVSDKDLLTLEKSVVDKLLNKAKQSASSKLSSGQELLPVVFSTKFDEKKFDKKADQEAKSVKLAAKIVYTLGTYNKDELGKFLGSAESFDVPDDFKLSDEESEIKIFDVKKNKNDVSATLSFNAIYKPTLSISGIPNDIKGKGVKSTEEQLKNISGVSEVKIILKNSLPILPSLLPLRPENISIQVKTQEL